MMVIQEDQVVVPLVQEQVVEQNYNQLNQVTQAHTDLVDKVVQV